MWQYKIYFKGGKLNKVASWGGVTLQSDKILTKDEMTQKISEYFKGLKNIIILDYVILPVAKTKVTPKEAYPGNARDNRRGNERGTKKHSYYKKKKGKARVRA